MPENEDDKDLEDDDLPPEEDEDGEDFEDTPEE